MHMSTIKITPKRFHIEAFIWISAIITLATVNPYSEGHYTLCLFNNLGLSFCPGCGIGRSISCVLHGNILDSFNFHPLGILAILILLYRIFTIFRQNPIIKINKTHQTK